MAEPARVPTGIEGLDRLLHGGFPLGTTTLLVGDAGTGKSTFAKQFIAEGLSNGEGAIVVLTAQPIQEFIESFEQIGFAIHKHLEKLTFIDLYSWRSPFSGGKKDGPYRVLKPEDLNDINKILQEALQSLSTGKSRVAFDSISDILLFEQSQSVFKLMQLFATKIHSKQSAAVAIIEGGMHKPEDLNTFEYIFSNLIEMKMDSGKRYLRVRKMQSTEHPLQWIEYHINNGIQMKVSPIFK